MLTAKQYQLLQFIDFRLKERGIPPSFDEMKDALLLHSKSGIHRLVSGLEERGFIRRLPHRARAIEVLKMPRLGAGESSSFRPVLVKGGADDEPLRHVGSDTVQVPLMGAIAAGSPIAAIQNRTSSIGVPAEMLGAGEHYALTVRGDSMKGAGIMDGDTALIRRRDTAVTGDIVVALIDGEEATLKRFRRKGGSIALEPANSEYETRILAPERVSVQGKLVGICRRY